MRTPKAWPPSGVVWCDDGPGAAGHRPAARGEVHAALAGGGQLHLSDRRQGEGYLRQARHRYQHQPRVWITCRGPGDRVGSVRVRHHDHHAADPAERQGPATGFPCNHGLRRRHGRRRAGRQPDHQAVDAGWQEGRRRAHLGRVPVLPGLCQEGRHRRRKASSSSTPTTRCWNACCRRSRSTR